MPRQQQPDHLRVAYYQSIKPVCDLARHYFDQEASDILRLLIHLRSATGKMDADESERAKAMIDRAARRTVDAMRPTQLFEAAREFGKRTTDFQKAQLDRQIVSAIGIGVGEIEAPVRENIDAFATGNVNLIVTVPDRYFERLKNDVQDAFAGGTHPETLAKDFADRYDMSLDDARRIARDQIGKLNAQVNQDRQEGLGIEGYTWRTMNDQRVRDEHEEREGEHFEWDAPPEDGHPGEAVLCRCYAEPDVSKLLEDAEA